MAEGRRLCPLSASAPSGATNRSARAVQLALQSESLANRQRAVRRPESLFMNPDRPLQGNQPAELRAVDRAAFAAGADPSHLEALAGIESDADAAGTLAGRALRARRLG